MSGDEAAQRLAQAMWDARRILGFDLDGDPTPAATLTCGYQQYIEYFLADMREMRRDYDSACEEVCLDPAHRRNA